MPPLVTGRVPLTCVVRLTADKDPPSVKLPELVTVPDKDKPCTVPVPPTEVTVPLLVAATVIAPAPLVTVMPVPAVSVALAKVLPVVFPISNCPFV